MNDPGAAALPGTLLCIAIALQAVSGLPMAIPRMPAHLGQKLAAALMAIASLAGTAGSVMTLIVPATHTFTLSWGLPFGPAEFGADPLSAIFLLPVFIVTGCGAVYAVAYWPAAQHPGNVRKLTFFLGLLAAALGMVVLARNTMLFLIAWEIMAIAAYFALTTEDENPEVRDAGTLYMITAHIGTLALFAMFSLLRHVTGDYLFPAQASLSAVHGLAAGIFVAALIGFGFKAGMMPLHIWLPSAHANAPSHISAILSGVVLKSGIYGLVRICSFFFDLPLWWGCTILALGIVSGIIGVAFALGQHDLKRLLAYHSIENIGIILMGMGVALIGQSAGNPALMVLGMAGALLHVFNHATFKALLFLGAGSVIHATGTREIDLMGGVSRRLPWTSLFFLVGAVAICGLPPLNGFVSELLVYLGSFTAIGSSKGAAAALPALAAPALALVGALAVACFVKVYGIVFLGAPRSREHAHGHEAPTGMLIPMALLACVCALVGLAPRLFAPLLNSAVLGWRPQLADFSGRLETMVPFGWISLLATAAVVLCAVMAALLARRAAKQPRAKSVTWGCGYLRPTSRIQYSASSFAEMLVQQFKWVMRPEVHRPEISGIFPGKARFSSHVPETALERAYTPLLEYLYVKTVPIRRLQSGQLPMYILYIFVTLIVLMVVDIG
jgi:formate hydrogenlyase subunit 3/multisubunit Na+/H+ antiporter MnhD subunit